MSYRSRTQDLRTPTAGSYRYLAGGQWYTVYRSVTMGINRVTEDEVGDWEEDNLFHSYFYRRAYPRLNGTVVGGGKVFQDFVIDGYHVPQAPNAPFPHPNWAAVALDAAARTNPSKPAICLPAFLGELKDLPMLLRSIPETLRNAGGKYIAGAPRWLRNPKAFQQGPIQGLAGANLGYQFGWRPFVADLLKLLNGLRALANALALIEQLLAGKPIKRRCYFPPRQSYTDHGVFTSHSLGTVVRHRKESVWHSREWCTTRWALTPDTPLPNVENLEDLLLTALQLAFGIHSFGLFAAAWELLGWSWLIDWFWNLGKWLSANQNFLRLRLVSICWCRTTSSFTSFTKVSGPDAGLALDGEYFTASSLKERHPISPSLALLPPLPSLPALTPGQLSILGSLLAMRSRHAF